LGNKTRIIKTVANEPAAANAGSPERLTHALSALGRENENKQQVNPALRLPAGR